MAIGRQLRLRLFLEGIEVPVIGASVQFGVNAPASASIQVVPSTRVRRFKARTVTHLFYLDDREAFNPPSDEAVYYDDPRWKLLYSGEVHGYSWMKSDDNRTASLVCQDDTTYWDLVKRYYYDELSFNYHQKLASKFQDGTAMPYDVVLGPAASLASIIRKECRTYPKMKGLLSGIIRLLESLGGYHEGTDASGKGLHTRGVGDFFTVSQLRLKFYQQLGASDLDDSCVKLLDSKEFYNWTRNLVSQGGNMFTLRQVLDALLNVIFYQYTSNPVAEYRKSAGESITKTGVTEAAPADICAKVLLVMNQISDILVSPEAFPKAITAPLPSAEDIRLTSAQTALLRSANAGVNAYHQGFRDYREKTRRGDTGDITIAEYAEMDRAAQQDAVAQSKAGKAMLERALEQYNAFLKKYSKDIHWSKETKTAPKERLFTTLLAPDIFFCPPPLCNVIFPDDYSRLDGSRMMTQEVSRLMLTTPTVLLGEESALPFNNKLYHFAPMVDTVDGLPIKEALAKTRRFLLPHEVYTGPIPYIDWFSDIRHYDPLLQWQGGSILKSLHQAQATAQQKERGIADNIPYLQHVANYTLARMRYSARSMTVPMRFKPHLVAGLPALVIDKYVPPVLDSQTGQKVPAAPDPENRAEHWLCVPMQITHTVTQVSAQTVAQMGYVHSHTEIDELFDNTAVAKERTGTAKKRIKYVVPLQVLLAGGIPRYGGKVVSLKAKATGKQYVSDLSKAISEAIADYRTYKAEVVQQSNKEGDVIGALRNVGDSAKDALLSGAAVASETLAAGGSALVSLAGTAGATIGFLYKFEVTEEVAYGTFTDRTIEVPFEDQVRPPWLSTCFHNSNITKYYKDLLGVGSIMDFGTRLKGAADTEGVDTGVSVSTTDTGLTVQAAVENIAHLYSVARESGDPQVLEDLSYSLTKRPIATMLQMLGSFDLKYDTKGQRVSGVEGFHSKAFGGSVFEDMSGVSDATGKADLSINQNIDPRAPRREAIVNYVVSLQDEASLRG